MNGSDNERENLEAAAEWLVTLRSGDASDSDVAAFESWLQSSPSHIAACRSVEQTFLRLPGPGMTGGDAVRDVLLRPSGRRAFLRQTLAWGAVGGLGLLTYAGRVYRPLAFGATAATVTGRRQSLALADIGVVHLDAQTAIDREGQGLVLRTGAVAIDTAGSPAVTLRHGETLATMHGSGRLALNLVDDRVLISSSGPSVVVRSGADSVVIGPTERALLLPSGVLVRQARKGGETSWISGILECHDEQLVMLVAHLRRYMTDVIVLADSARDLRLSGRFSLDRPAETLATLAQSLPITLRRIAGVVTVIQSLR